MVYTRLVAPANKFGAKSNFQHRRGATNVRSAVVLTQFSKITNVRPHLTMAICVRNHHTQRASARKRKSGGCVNAALQTQFSHINIYECCKGAGTLALALWRWRLHNTHGQSHHTHQPETQLTPHATRTRGETTPHRRLPSSPQTRTAPSSTSSSFKVL